VWGVIIYASSLMNGFETARRRAENMKISTKKRKNLLTNGWLHVRIKKFQ